MEIKGKNSVFSGTLGTEYLGSGNSKMYNHWRPNANNLSHIYSKKFRKALCMGDYQLTIGFN